MMRENRGWVIYFWQYELGRDPWDALLHPGYFDSDWVSSNEHDAEYKRQQIEADTRPEPFDMIIKGVDVSIEEMKRLAEYSFIDLKLYLIINRGQSRKRIDDGYVHKVRKGILDNIQYYEKGA